MVRKAKSGSGTPVHVIHSTDPGNCMAVCHDKLCRDARKIAHFNDRVSYLCEHLKSTDYAALQTKQPFDIEQVGKMNFTDRLKERINDRFLKASGDNDAPLVVLFEDTTLSKSPAYLYLSVYDPQDNSQYAEFNRVITTVDLAHKHFTCRCPYEPTCLHIMISKMYLLQIHPELIICAEPEPEVNRLDSENMQPETDDVNFMIDYILREKTVPLKLPLTSEALLEIIPDEFTPSEENC